MDWEQEFHGVAVRYEPKVVRVRTDSALMACLAAPHRGARALARHIRARYRERLGCALSVSEHSLAVELLCHAYCDALIGKIARIFAALPGALGEKIKNALLRFRVHTEITDIGERSVDTNRWIFDALAPVYGLFCKLRPNRAKKDS